VVISRSGQRLLYVTTFDGSFFGSGFARIFPTTRMPFDYNDYQNKVNTLSNEQLQKEWENYTRQIAGGATSTGAAVLFSPLTAGISLIGLGLSTPRIHNARKKRAIIEKGLQERGATHNTRKRDVALPMAISGGIAGLTLGLAGPGADMLGGVAAEKGAEYLVAHAALDGTGAVIEHVHTEHEKKSADHKLQMKMQQQYIQQQAMVQGQQTNCQPGFPVQQSISHNPQYQYQYQTQSGYEPIYAPVPIPASQNMPTSYQPASHQQQLVQNTIQPQMARVNNEPQAAYQPGYQQQVFQPQLLLYQPETSQQQSPQQAPLLENQNASSHKAAAPAAGDNTPSTFQHAEKHDLVTIPTFSAQAGPIESSYFPEKSAAYDANIPWNGQEPCPTPAPAYSENPVMQSVDGALKKNTPADISMEEEISLLKARLLVMELEKRGVAVETLSTANAEPQPEIKPPTRPMSLMQSLSMQSNVVVSNNLIQAGSSATTRPESPSVEEPSNKLPEKDDSMPLVTNSLPTQSNSSPPASPPTVPPPPPTHSTPVQTQQYSSPPAPPLSAHLPISATPPKTEQLYVHQPQAQYQPLAPAPNMYNPQNWAPIQQTSSQASAPNPVYQRHDSGYFSASQTPIAQPYAPTTPQLTPGQYFPHQRTASVSTMSPPPPYFPPPPGQPIPNANVIGKDYFNRNSIAGPPGGQQFGAPPPVQWGQPPIQTYQGMQGWQWGTAAPVRQEPNYGPPPPVPTAWKGS